MALIINRLIVPVVHKFRTSVLKSDLFYWQTCTPQERLDALEQMREEYHPWKGDDQQGFNRVYSIYPFRKLDGK